MASIELTAKTVDEARKQAAAKLGTSADQVKVTVLEETKGLFGKSQVRVRAEAADVVAPSAPEVVEDIQEGFDPQPQDLKKEPRRGGRVRSKKAEPAAEPVAEEAPAAAAPVAEESDERAATQEDADAMLTLVQELIEASGLTVSADIRDVSGRYVSIQLDGKDAAFLVGKHGEVINAFQYLVNIIATKRIPTGARCTLDANDYRRRREDALTRLANKIAEQVLERQEEAVLDALPAFERRIVHKALSVIPGVATYSEGEEPNRRVVIAPAE
jgi:spoIIIJ-associated protein